MKNIGLLLLFIFSLSFSFAQKNPLDHSVYDSWQHIGERMISNDGKWVVYTIDPQEGDNELVIQSSDATYKKTVPRGYTALITEDSRFVIFKIKPLYKNTREAKIKKLKADDSPKDSLAIIELGKESIWKTDKVKNYKTPAKSFGWVAYQLDRPFDAVTKTKAPAKQTNAVADSLKKVIDSLKQVIENLPVKKKKQREDDFTDVADAEGDDPASPANEKGNDMVLRNLITGEEIVFYKTLEYYFSKVGNKLLVEKAKDPLDTFSKHAVVIYDCTAAKSVMLSNGGNDFKNFTMTDDAGKIAYLAERDAKPKELQKDYRVWYYQQGMDSAMKLADKNSVDMKLGMTISEYGNLNFSKNGKRLFFGVAPLQSVRDTSLVEFDYPKVDIWHYNDDYLQTVQNYPARLRAAQQENFLTVYDLDKIAIHQLANKQIPQVLQTNEGDGDTFVGITDAGKRIQSQWEGTTLKDVYAIDVNAGDKKLVKENLLGQVYPSSTGKYIMWYDRKIKNYFTWDGNTTRNITAGIKVPLYEEDWDTPDDANNYGVMGWYEGEDFAFIYDKFDIWKVDLTNKIKPTTIWEGTENFDKTTGRITKTSYRYIKTDLEERFIPSGKEIIIKGFNNDTKSESLHFLVLGKSNIFAYISEYTNLKSSIRFPVKAKGTFALIYTKEDYKNSPNLFINHSFKDETKLSSINPQQSDYNWGTAELFKWKAYNGKEATGIVYKPEDFDPKKKYPMIVYFYEKLSDGLYGYKEPAPIRSAINVPFFVSRGYIIFMPDIEYKTGYPGQGAYDYIVSGARALVKKGFVDSTKMGLQGHSWGGYQAAQVATMTKLFKAIWAGAPVANMTSAYGGIRWESGVSRQFQYEKTQSRIGATLWQKPDLYIKNSPLFHLDKVTAPMVIMANDADGAVPWYQGIELFSGLRRLGKKVWMFNYNGQGHGLTQRQDMRDYQIRMQQFFDWMLKGEPPAKWITEGVPALKKGKEWGLEIE